MEETAENYEEVQRKLQEVSDARWALDAELKAAKEGGGVSTGTGQELTEKKVSFWAPLLWFWLIFSGLLL